MSLDQYYQGAKYHKINDYRKNAIIRWLTQNSHKTILDIGCSNGILGQEVKKLMPCRFFGTDISAQAVHEAKQVLDNAWQFNLEDEIVNWPEELRQNNYDAIVLSEVLEHLFEPENLLIKLKELPQADKEILITVPNLLFWKNRLKIFFGQFNYTNQGIMDKSHIHFFSWASFKKMIADSGYRIIEIDNHAPTRGTKQLVKIWPGLFAYRFIVKIAIK
ncbi:MAG: class I SAM-dependent methyltransferase [Patescibacteria group bacterium]|jgi:2-polyprenyl-3-methyl-5-hydroxy-6-metoxy-1,4-benzoquinol methylase